MVFISYSHKDDKWFGEFRTMSKPLQRYVGLEFWSDKEIGASGDWRKAINRALKEADIAVLLVSAEFLASKFIADVELPLLLERWGKGDLHMLWIALTPCHYKLSGLSAIQAVAPPSKPLNGMSEYAYQATLLQACDEIDTIVREKEKPVINKALHRGKFEHHQKKLQVLAKPAVRDTYVLLHAGGKWYTQGKIARGGMKCDCWIGDEKYAKPGHEYRIIAITRDAGENVKAGAYAVLPDFRTKSEEITVIRK